MDVGCGLVDVIREVGAQAKGLGFSIWQLFGLLALFIVAWAWRSATVPLVLIRGWKRPEVERKL